MKLNTKAYKAHKHGAGARVAGRVQNEIRRSPRTGEWEQIKTRYIVVRGT